MLTHDLLVARVRGDEITPAFAMPDPEHVELAQDLVAIFSDHTGKKLGELNAILAEMEDQGFDYRLVRGLVSLLERRCDLAVDSPVDPAAARRAAFHEAACRHPVTSAAARRAVIESAARSLGLDAGTLEQALYADLEGELLIRGFRPPAPEELLAWYNLSLAQTLLFRATQLKFHASAGHKDVLRQVKRLGLMYDASLDSGRVEVAVDGPASALKLTERYGASFAKLLPLIVRSPGWSMEAVIARKDFEGNPRLYRFSMSERRHGYLFGPGRDEPVEFDSAVEEAFYGSLADSGSGWAITREPEPLIAGPSLFIPDFLLEKEGVRVYVEIAGFWTPDYLRRKVAKLKKVKDEALIVLADSRLTCEALDAIPGVIFYDRKVSLRPVLERLKALEKARATEGSARIARAGLKLEGDVIRLTDLAVREGVSVEAVRMYLEEHCPANYALVAEELVSEGLLRELEDLLPATMPYAEAAAAIRDRGIAAADIVLQRLGYAVKWSGLDPDGAVVSKTGRKPSQK